MRWAPPLAAATLPSPLPRGDHKAGGAGRGVPAPGCGVPAVRVLWLLGLARREVHVTFCLRKQRSGSFQWEMEEEDGGRGRLPSWKHGGEAQAGSAGEGGPPCRGTPLPAPGI